MTGQIDTTVSGRVDFEAVIEELRVLVRSDDRAEVACGKLLRVALQASEAMRALLMPVDLYTAGQPAEFLLTSEEVRMQTGRLDISATFYAFDSDNRKKPYAVVWELKAPQCPAYRSYNSVRWKGTSELFHAEEQLLFYVAEAKQSGIYHSGVNTKIFGEQVRSGGIIIGRDSDLPEQNSDDDTKYAAIKSLRSECFHSFNKFRVYSWDHVLRFAAPKKAYRDIDSHDGRG